MCVTEVCNKFASAEDGMRLELQYCCRVSQDKSVGEFQAEHLAEQPKGVFGCVNVYIQMT